MKNLDITVVGPQGSGKTTLAKNILNVIGLTPERVAYLDLDETSTPEAIVDALRAAAADAVVFDVPTNCSLLAVAEAVELYREYTHRNVAAIYCIQSKFTNFLNPSSND